MIGLSCYILADTFFISLKMGQTGLAALNLSSPSFNLVFSIGMMFAVGGGTKFAIHKGAQNDNEANKVFTHTVFIVALLRLFLLCSAYLRHALWRCFSARKATLSNTATHMFRLSFALLRSLCSTMFFKTLYETTAREACDDCIACGQSFQYSIRLRSGVSVQYEHARSGTCHGLFSDCEHSYPFFACHSQEKHVPFQKTKLSLRTYGGICSLGLAPFINELSFAAVLMVFNGLFKRLGGDTAIAAYAIIINVFYVVNSVFNGIANGTQPMISFSYGQSDHQKSVAYCATPSSPSPPLPSCCILQYSSGRTESQASSTRKV